MVPTQSATPLKAIDLLVDYTGLRTWIWLRKNISEETCTDESDNAYIRYTADETSFVVDGTPTEAEIEAQFDTLWAKYNPEEATVEERITVIETMLNDAYLAIAELGTMVTPTAEVLND